MAKKIRLTNKNDDYTGTKGPDNVLGLDGNDTMLGGKGNDTLDGGDGNDKLDGGLGNDRLLGGAGNDQITATSGDDTAIGGTGTDTVTVKGDFADADVTKVAGGYQIVSGGNTTIVKSVEFVKFDDGKVSAADLINDAPTGTATAVLGGGTEDTTYIVQASNLLAGFSDPNGDTLSVTNLTASDGAQVVDNGDGTFTITLAPNDNGVITLSYSVTDGELSTAATQTITCTPVNDPPTAAATQAVNATEDTEQLVTITASDVDGDSLIYTAGAAANGGTIVNNNDGTFTYKGAANYSGADSFVVTISDGHGGTTQQTVNVTVAADNDAPVVAGVADVQVLNDSGSIFPTFAVSDVEGDFGAGSVLTVSSDSGSDAFGFNTTGNVSTAANNVLVNGVGVGTYSMLGGVLTITFNAFATEANIETVGKAIKADLADDSGTATVTVTLTDSDGATSTVASGEVTTLLSLTQPAIDDVNGDSQVTGIANGALAVDDNLDANVNYVALVGVGNVNDVDLTITLGGDNDPADILTIPTALDLTPGTASIANISGNLVYRTTGGTEYNVGTVVTGPSTISVSLSDTVGNSGLLSATDFDGILELIIHSTTVDSGANDGVRDVTFLINGVGTVSTTATASLVVTDGGTISLTAGVDTDGTLVGIDPTGINVFDALVGTLQSTDSFSAGSTVNDIMTAVLTAGATIAPTIGKIETFNISNNGGAVSTLNAAGITNTNAMEINITGANGVTLTNVGSTFDTIDASAMTGGAVDITTATNQSLDVITGVGATTVTSDGTGTIDVDATLANALLDINGSADFVISGTVDVDVNAAGTTDSVTISNIIGSSTVTTGTDALTISDSDADPITVNAAAMADNMLLSVAGEATLGVINLEGNLDLTGFLGDDSSTVVFENVIADGAATVTLGAFAAIADASTELTVTAAAGTITIDATAATTKDTTNVGVVDANENVDLDINGAASFVLSGLTADVDAAGTTGSVTLNTVAAANIAVVTGDDDTNLNGAAALVTINAGAMNATADAITIGTLADDFAGNVIVNALGFAVNGSTLDAKYLTGSLTATTDAVASIVLGAGITSFSLTAGGLTSVNALGYLGSIDLQGASDVTLNNVATDVDGDGVASDYTGIATINLAANAGIDIATGEGSVTVTSGDTDGADLDALLDGTRSAINVNASEMENSKTLAINDSAGVFNLNITVTGLGATLLTTENQTVDMSGSAEASSTATATLSTVAAGLVNDTTLNVSTGTHATTTINASLSAAALLLDNAEVVTDYEVVVNAAGSADGASLVLTGSADFSVTGALADVNASAVTGYVSIVGGIGGQTIIGGSAGSTLDGGAGLDLLTGSNGDADIFEFQSGETGGTVGTADHITNFVINEDVIDLGDYGVVFGDLLIAIGVGSTVITVDGGDKIVLDGSYIGQTFTADQFAF